MVEGQEANVLGKLLLLLIQMIAAKKCHNLDKTLVSINSL